MEGSGTEQELGVLLKQARENKNLSLADVEAVTSIRGSLLERLEEGKIQGSISRVYHLGFIKQYANFLGLDGDHLLETHSVNFYEGGDEEFTIGIGTLEMRTGADSGSKSWSGFRLVSLMILITALSVLAYYLVY